MGLSPKGIVMCIKPLPSINLEGGSCLQPSPFPGHYAYPPIGGRPLNANEYLEKLIREMDIKHRGEMDKKCKEEKDKK